MSAFALGSWVSREAEVTTPEATAVSTVQDFKASEILQDLRISRTPSECDGEKCDSSCDLSPVGRMWKFVLGIWYVWLCLVIH